MPQRFALYEMPAARALLDEVAHKLEAQGQPLGRLRLHGDDQEYLFDIRRGVSYTDHLRVQRGVNCQVCPSHPQLRFEFVVTDVNGKEHGPIGSTCVFKSVLGVEEAQRVGQSLETQARRAAEAARRSPEDRHREEHLGLLEGAGNFREYLRGLGFSWVLTDLATHNRMRLGEPLFRRLEALLGGRVPLERGDFLALKDMTLPEDQAPRVPARPRVGALAALNRGAEPATLPRGGRRGRPSADRPMAPADWAKYLQNNRLQRPHDFWPWFRQFVALPEGDLDDAGERLRSRRALRLEQRDAVLAAYKNHHAEVDSHATAHRREAGDWKDPWLRSLDRLMVRAAAPPSPPALAAEPVALPEPSGAEDGGPFRPGEPALLPDLPRFLGQVVLALHEQGDQASASFFEGEPSAQSDFIRDRLYALYLRVRENDFCPLLPSEVEAVHDLITGLREHGVADLSCPPLPEDLTALFPRRVYLAWVRGQLWRVSRVAGHPDRLSWATYSQGRQSSVGTLQTFEAWLTEAGGS